MFVREVLFWTKCVQAMNDFVSSKNGSMLELAALAPVNPYTPSKLRRRWATSQLRGEKTKAVSALAIVEADATIPIQKKPPT